MICYLDNYSHDCFRQWCRADAVSLLIDKPRIRSELFVVCFAFPSGQLRRFCCCVLFVCAYHWILNLQVRGVPISEQRAVGSISDPICRNSSTSKAHPWSREAEGGGSGGEGSDNVALG